MAGEMGDIVQAFDISVGPITGSGTITTAFGDLTPDSVFLVARVLTVGTRAGLEPIERLSTDDAGSATSVEPEDGSGSRA